MGIASLAVKDAMWNFGHNISLFPSFVRVQMQVNKEVAKLASEEREKRKEDREEIKKSRKDKLFAQETSKAVHEYVQQKADTEIVRAQLIGRSVESNKWIAYALYYMSNPEAKLVQADPETCKFVNTISQYFCFGKIYESAEIGDIKDYDVSTEGTDKFLICIDDLSVKMQDEALMSKILARRNAMTSVKTEEAPDENKAEETASETAEEAVKIPNFVKEEKEMIKPITFTVSDNPTPLPDPEADPTPVVDVVNATSYVDEQPQAIQTLPENIQKIIDRDVEPILNEMGIQRTYQMMPNGLVQLTIIETQTHAPMMYTIDPGIVMGRGKASILMTISYPLGDTVFVDVTDNKELVKKMLGSPWAILTEEETQKVILTQFKNQEIYRYFDLSSTEFLNKLSGEEFEKFGKKLTFIINTMKKQIADQQTDCPRLRFNHFKSIDDFIVISDKFTVSPLADIGCTTPAMLEGLMYICEGDKITQKLRDQMVEFTIEKYGEM